MEFLVWMLENLWLLLSHITSKSAFPKPLEPEEESRLVEEMLLGNGDAERRLVEHNLRLVAHIAKKYRLSGTDLDDLVSIGSIGLMKAVHTFKPEAGRLTTYASRCIENEILMHLRAQKKTRNTVFLNDPIGADKEGNEVSLIDLMGTERDIVSEEVETHIESVRAMKKLYTELTDRERTVLTLRYGLNGDASEPQHEVARRLGISRSYVSRIEKRALEKLKQAMDAPDDFREN